MFNIPIRRQSGKDDSLEFDDSQAALRPTTICPEMSRQKPHNRDLLLPHWLEPKSPPRWIGFHCTWWEPLGKGVLAG